MGYHTILGQSNRIDSLKTSFVLVKVWLKFAYIVKIKFEANRKIK